MPRHAADETDILAKLGETRRRHAAACDQIGQLLNLTLELENLADKLLDDLAQIRAR
jgi:hypothetical protein